jgi:hypothetical protein
VNEEKSTKQVMISLKHILKKIMINNFKEKMIYYARSNVK